MGLTVPAGTRADLRGCVWGAGCLGSWALQGLAALGQTEAGRLCLPRGRWGHTGEGPGKPQLETGGQGQGSSPGLGSEAGPQALERQARGQGTSLEQEQQHRDTVRMQATQCPGYHRSGYAHSHSSAQPWEVDTALSRVRRVADILRNYRTRPSQT